MLALPAYRALALGWQAVLVEQLAVQEQRGQLGCWGQSQEARVVQWQEQLQGKHLRKPLRN